MFPPAAQPVTLAGLASITLVFDIFLTSDAGGTSLTCAVGVLDSQVTFPQTFTLSHAFSISIPSSCICHLRGLFYLCQGTLTDSYTVLFGANATVYSSTPTQSDIASKACVLGTLL